MKILLSLILSFFMFNLANANDIYSYNFKGAEKGEIKLEDYKDRESGARHHPLKL